MCRDSIFVLDGLQVVYTDLPLVVSAPTGSGKTVVFELAILRLMIQLKESLSSVKIVYVAPIKALCSERCEAWKEMFHPLGLECTELTGDTQVDDFFELQKANIITTTPVGTCMCIWCKCFKLILI